MVWKVYSEARRSCDFEEGVRVERIVWAAARREESLLIMANMSSMRAEVHSLVTAFLSFSYLALAWVVSRVFPRMLLQP